MEKAEALKEVMDISQRGFELLTQAYFVNLMFTLSGVAIMLILACVVYRVGKKHLIKNDHRDAVEIYGMGAVAWLASLLLIGFSLSMACSVTIFILYPEAYTLMKIISSLGS